MTVLLFLIWVAKPIAFFTMVLAAFFLIAHLHGVLK